MAKWIRQSLTAWLLKTGIWGPFVLGLVFMPDRFTWVAGAVFLAVLAFHIWIQLGLAVRLSRRLGLLTPPPERLLRIVTENSRSLARPCHTWVLETPLAYAAALPITGDLLFSRYILEALPDEEIAAICAHEVGHLTESQPTLLIRWAGSLILLPWLFARPMLNEFGIHGLLPLLLVSFLVNVLVRRVARKMEVRADKLAGEQQISEGTYARALERIYRRNITPAVMPGNRAVHPHLYDRMLAAGVTPDFPRPDQPQKLTWTGRLHYILSCGLAGILIGRLLALSH